MLKLVVNDMFSYLSSTFLQFFDPLFEINLSWKSGPASRHGLFCCDEFIHPITFRDAGVSDERKMGGKFDGLEL